MKNFARLLAIVAAALLAWTASAQEAYPAKPIRLIVPFPPGAGTDTVARYVAQKLGESMKATIVIDNKTGAGGAIGAAEAARADPDGYTLLFVAGPFTTVAASSKNPGYDPVKQFVPVAPIAAGPLAFVVGNDVPANTMREFIALAKQKPGNAQLRLGRHRQHQPSRARTPERARRHQHRARAVPRHRRRDQGPAGRQHPGDDRVDSGDAAAGRREKE